MIVLGWSFLALAGALPLYLVNTPCIGDLPSDVVSQGFSAPPGSLSSPSGAVFEGSYSTLNNLSLLRLLRLFDLGQLTKLDGSRIFRREVLSKPDPFNAHIRVIVLTALTILLGLLPPLIKIIKEFNKVVAYRQRWLEYKCEGKDMGWLSARSAPGFRLWGEKQLKDYLVKIGLSSTLNESGSRNANGTRARNGEKRTRRREEEQPLNRADDSPNNAEVDIQSLFSIG